MIIKYPYDNTVYKRTVFNNITISKLINKELA